MNQLLSFTKGNWKTSVAGILALLGSIPVVNNIAQPILDTQPKTKVDWVSVAIGIGLLFAKDYNVTGGTKQNNSVS